MSDLSVRHGGTEHLQLIDGFATQLNDPVIVAEPTARIVYVNGAFERQTGYTRDDAVGRSLALLQGPDSDPQAFAQLRSALEERTHMRCDFLAYRKDGTAVWLDVALNPIADQDGRPTHGLAITRDITARKLAEETLRACSKRTEEEVRKLTEQMERRVNERTARLAATNAELKAFTYSVSHDLRAPLRQLDGFARLLIEHAAETVDETASHYARSIVNAANKMARLIDGLLTLSRTGRSELRTERVELNAMVEEVQRELASTAKHRCIAWLVHPLPAVEADPALLRQVLVNLLSNAIKYTRPCPAARIEVGAMGGKDAEVIVLVQDNGVGFDPQYASRLFAPFQRLHSASDFEGDGIGLAIVRRIIERHGGRVWAEGALNQGATFYFSLPAASTACQPPR